MTVDWSFDGENDMEREIVERILPVRDVHDGYTIEVTLLNEGSSRRVYVTNAGRHLDPTKVMNARLAHVNWDGWDMTFVILDDDYGLTGDSITIPYDLIGSIHVP